jgi:TonB-linked SusC/RagA family outer membrane protein
MIIPQIQAHLINFFINQIFISMKKMSLLIIVFLSTMAMAIAQKTVTGTVKDASGDAIIGASVLVQGSSVGTVTDIDGNFSVDLPAGSTTLIVSFVGFNEQTVDVSNVSSVLITLAEGQVLEEIVVTAQGIRRDKKALGYAVSTVGEKEIADRPVADVGRLLQGKVAGVNITSTSGVSGSGTNVTVRGYSSITGSNQALFVVDGVPFNSGTNTTGNFANGGQNASSRFLDLDPNNIESVSVLKGLAATVTYGDQGRNGVILITTKSGAGGKKKASFTLTQSAFTNKAHLPRYQNDYIGGFQQNLGYFFSNWGPTIEEAKIYPALNTNAALNTHPFAFLGDLSLRAAMAPYVESLGQYALEVFPDNVSGFFRTGRISNTNLSAAGGSDAVSYNLSAGYTDEQGYIKENNLQRLNMSLGLNAKLTSRLTATTSFAFTNTNQVSPPITGGGGNGTFGTPSVLANVFFTPRQVDLNGWPYESPVDGRTVYFRGPNDIPNPNWIVKNYKYASITNRIFSATNFNFKISDAVNLLYKVGLDTYTEDIELQYNKGGVNLPLGQYLTTDVKNTIWDNSLIASLQKSLGSDLTISARLGGNIRNDKNFRDGAVSSQQIARSVFRHSNFIDQVAFNGTVEETRMGVFGDLSFDYKQGIFLNFAGRNDWTSTVEPENRRILYPSVSLSFVPTSMFEGMTSDALSYLKLRAGVGTSAGFPNPYSTRNVLGQAARGWMTTAGAAVQTQTVDNFLGNPNLKPELHTEYEAGIEAKGLNNKLSIEVTGYRRDTRDLITNSPLDPSTGYTSTTINIGRIRNVGTEVNLGIKAVETSKVGYDIGFIYSRNVPTVIDLGGQLEQVQITGFGGGLGNYAEVGKPFNIIKGIGWRTNDQGEYLIDGGGRLITTPGPIVLGDPNPLFNVSMSNGIRLGDFTIDALITYRHGGAIYSATALAMMGRGLTEDTGLSAGYDRAQTYILPGVKNSDGTPNNVQITASDVGFNNLYFFGDQGGVYDGTTWRIQEISLSYNLPKNIFSKTPFKGASFQLSGNNLWYKAINVPKGINFDSDNLGLGVGNGLGFEFFTGPSARRIGGTLKLQF